MIIIVTRQEISFYRNIYGALLQKWYAACKKLLPTGG